MKSTRTRKTVVATPSEKFEKFVWLVVGPHVWGKGFSFRQAFDAAGKPKLYIAFVSSDPWITVDEMGRLTYFPAEGADVHARPYYTVALRATKGKMIEISVADGDTRQFMPTGKHDTVDDRYNCHV